MLLSTSLKRRVCVPVRAILLLGLLLPALVANCQISVAEGFCTVEDASCSRDAAAATAAQPPSSATTGNLNNDDVERLLIDVLTECAATLKQQVPGRDAAERSLAGAAQRLLEATQDRPDMQQTLLYLGDVMDSYLNGRFYGAVPVDGDSCQPNEAVVAALSKIVSQMSSKSVAREPPNNFNMHRPRENKTLPTWKKFENNVNQYELYSESNGGMVAEILSAMQRQQIVEIQQLPSAGTQLKLVLTFADGSLGLFKPKRLSRDHEVSLDVHYYNDFDRHTAEIAAFHLDRLLGFRRVPPVTGAFVDMVDDIYELADDNLRATFFLSPVGNQCFYGTCSYFCDPPHAVCGVGTQLEGSIAYYVPNDGPASWFDSRSPWRRSYLRDVPLARWQESDDGSYCDEVRKNPPFDNQRSLLNLIDMHIFDFLAGNLDRHHYYLYENHGNDSFMITIDNGRGFGRAMHDELSILAPLYQCCMVRLSTVETLLTLYTSPPADRLSQRMNRSLQSDPLSPVLTDAHLRALDRRLGIILDQIHRCLTSGHHQPADHVVVDDGW